MRKPLRNITMYHPEELGTTHQAVNAVIKSSQACFQIWRLFYFKTPVDAQELDYADALELMLLTLAYERDEARRELEAIANEQLADARQNKRPEQRGEPTQRPTGYGEPTQVAR